MNTKTFQEVARIWSAAKQPIIKHATMCAYMLTLQTHYSHIMGRRQLYRKATFRNLFSTSFPLVLLKNRKGYCGGAEIYSQVWWET